MKKIGVIILLLGLTFTFITTANLLMKERVTDVDKIKITQVRIHSQIWEPMAGAIVLLIGTGIYMAGKKSKMKVRF